jgi:hypothetical protein
MQTFGGEFGEVFGGGEHAVLGGKEGGLGGGRGPLGRCWWLAIEGRERDLTRSDPT